jgi:aromatase
MRWLQDFQMKPTAPVDDEGMAARINHNTPIQMARIKKFLESGRARGASEASPAAASEDQEGATWSP